MQSIVNRFSQTLCIKSLYIMGAPLNLLLSNTTLTSKVSEISAISSCFIHTGAVREAWYKQSGPRKWLNYNKKIYPPQHPEEERRPAFVCHSRANIKYPPKKMWYIASMIRGMTIDEAIKQLSFVSRLAALSVKETLIEAQEIAVRDHNVEFKSNLWVAESFVVRGAVIKGLRRHARRRAGVVEYKHSHYLVRLEEGKPPLHYYTPPKSGEEMLEDWITKMRQRKIIASL